MRQQVGGGTRVTSLHPVQALYIQYTVRSDVSKANRTTEEEGEVAGLKVLRVSVKSEKRAQGEDVCTARCLGVGVRGRGVKH